MRLLILAALIAMSIVRCAAQSNLSDGVRFTEKNVKESIQAGHFFIANDSLKDIIFFQGAESYNLKKGRMICISSDQPNCEVWYPSEFGQTHTSLLFQYEPKHIGAIIYPVYKTIFFFFKKCIGHEIGLVVKENENYICELQANNSSQIQHLLNEYTFKKKLGRISFGRSTMINS